MARFLGERAAAELYEAFLEDTVRLCREAAERARARLELWAAAGEEGESYFAERFPGLLLRRQRGPDLGARLVDAFARSFSAGAEHVVIVGSDHPTLPADYAARSLRALRAAQLVLGPSRDGGYYAVGLRRPAWPRAQGLFAGVPWSTPEVLHVTRVRARELDLCHVELPEWYDVDRPEDLERLRADAAPGSHSRRALDRLTGDR